MSANVRAQFKPPRPKDPPPIRTPIAPQQSLLSTTKKDVVVSTTAQPAKDASNIPQSSPNFAAPSATPSSSPADRVTPSLSQGKIADPEPPEAQSSPQVEVILAIKPARGRRASMTAQPSGASEGNDKESRTTAKVEENEHDDEEEEDEGVSLLDEGPASNTSSAVSKRPPSRSQTRVTAKRQKEEAPRHRPLALKADKDDDNSGLDSPHLARRQSSRSRTAVVRYGIQQDEGSPPPSRARKASRLASDSSDSESNPRTPSPEPLSNKPPPGVQSCLKFFQPVKQPDTSTVTTGATTTTSTSQATMQPIRFRKNLSTKRVARSNLFGSEDDEDERGTPKPIKLTSEDVANTELTFQRPLLPVCGLRNMGNTCFMNSVLQSLRACQPFRTEFLSSFQPLRTRESLRSPQRAIVNLCKTFEDMDQLEEALRAEGKGKANHIRPQDLLDSLASLNHMYARRVQQDAQEFLKFLLNLIHDEHIFMLATKDEPAASEALAPEESSGTASALSLDSTTKEDTTKPLANADEPLQPPAIPPAQPPPMPQSQHQQPVLDSEPPPSEQQQPVPQSRPQQRPQHLQRQQQQPHLPLEVSSDVTDGADDTPLTPVKRMNEVQAAGETKKAKKEVPITSFFTQKRPKTATTSTMLVVPATGDRSSEHDTITSSEVVSKPSEAAQPSRDHQSIDPTTAAVTEHPTPQTTKTVSFIDLTSTPTPTTTPTQTPSSSQVVVQPVNFVATEAQPSTQDGPATTVAVQAKSPRKTLFDDISASPAKAPANASAAATSTSAPSKSTTSLASSSSDLPLVLPSCVSEPTVIQRIFEGTMTYFTKCRVCETVTERKESFMELTLPVSSSECKSLPRILDDVAGHIEILKGSNKYHCLVCGTRTEAERSVKLSSLPPVLVLHFNRSTGERQRKIATSVPSPLTLRLGEWCAKSCPEADALYELQSIIFHTGASSSVGHYTADKRDNEVATDVATTSRWIHISDDDVEYLGACDVSRKMSPQSDSPATAYMLFYVRSS